MSNNPTTTLTVGGPQVGDVGVITGFYDGSDGDFSVAEAMTTDQAMLVMRELEIAGLVEQGIPAYRTAFPDSIASDEALRAHLRALAITYLDRRATPDAG